MSSNKTVSARRHCSPFIVATTGVAVCLAGGSAFAVSGNINVASNGNVSLFNAPALNIKVFGGLASFDLKGAGTGYLSGLAGGLQINCVASGSLIRHQGAGVNIASLTNFRTGLVYVAHNKSNDYIPMLFNNGGTRYGWVHCVSTNNTGSQLRIDVWSYNAAGGNIKTLDDSITPKALALTDGRVKLNWSNANEDGVARYEVQAKGANGAWAAVDSSTPGEGSYASTVQAGEYRLVVENSDGSSRSVNF